MLWVALRQPPRRLPTFPHKRDLAGPLESKPVSKSRAHIERDTLRHKSLLPHAFGFSLVILLLVACGIPQPIPTSILPTPTATATPTPTPPTVVTPAQVLFIGNSLTLFNDLPGMFAELARSGGHEVEVDMSAQGGWTCSDHATSAMTLDKIEQQNWHFVVLQEQSSIPAIADQGNEYMYPAIRLLESKISERGAITVLFMAWGRRDGLPSAGYKDFAAMQAQVQAGYMEIGNELDAMVAPVGIAWQNGIAQDPQLGLWQTDGLHPSTEGSYLAACVFYAVIYQQSPEGLTYEAELPEEMAQFLQAIAAETVLENSEEVRHD